MVGAVGQAGDGLAAAEEEVGAARIADRPAAGLLGELEQGAALAERNDIVDQLGLGLGVELVGMRQRGIAPYRRARDPQHVRMGARLARARRRRGRRLGAPRQSEPVHLADHRVAGDAAKLCGNLTRRQPVGPKLLQHLDALVSPGHASSSSAVATAEKSGQNPSTGLGNDRLARRILPLPIYASDLSAARNVVSDNRNATIWRESGARVRTPRVHMLCPRLRKRPHLSAPVNLCGGPWSIFRKSGNRFSAENATNQRG